MFEVMDAYSQNAVIKVLGVGGGGGNAVAHMVTSGIEGVESAGAFNYTSSPNVIHTVNGNYVGRDRITQFVVQSTLATQRRRQR